MGQAILGVDRNLQQLLESDVEMKRDDDLLRALLKRLEDDPSPVHVHDLSLDASPQHELEYFHLRLLADAGYLEETGKYGGDFRITMAGHDFLGHTRDDGVWETVKERAGHLAGPSVQMLGKIAEEMVLEQARVLGILPR